MIHNNYELKYKDKHLKAELLCDAAMLIVLLGSIGCVLTRIDIAGHLYLPSLLILAISFITGTIASDYLICKKPRHFWFKNAIITTGFLIGLLAVVVINL